ncbi:hypothetical protein TRFO_12429 [Tritrichomonas foetus]|uniref:E3 ubiquitin-protein ligase listerin n=1 Tax=Tritrichomonas foetus TaxID=1144522 RepID=A0A1J4L1K5_9EUKA|nr:hypothetical protein TRFO_12429 [Tritrichomonas foetus]|eukprot:OHT17298.1 hypothetical protein TRFO_12429 [Tritrichomonas foetus]
MYSANDFASIANNIRDSEIKLIFKKLAKHNESIVKSGLTELINMLPNLDYHSTFFEIVGHCCVSLDYFLFASDAGVRALALKMIGEVIKRLKRDIVGYATLIFPTLLIYCYDEDVIHEADSVLEISFPTEEKKTALLTKMNYEICDKILTTLDSLKTRMLTNEIIGRVTASCLALVLKMIQTLGKDKTADLISKINVIELLKIDQGKFAPSVTPQMRVMAYKFLSYERINPEILSYMSFEDSFNSQFSLVNLIIDLLKNNNVQVLEVQNAFEKSCHLYLKPTPNLKDLLTLICDDEYIWKIMEIIIFLDSQKLFDLLLSLLNDKTIILPLFGKMVSLNPESDFLQTAPLSIFEFLNDNNEACEKIDEMMINGDENRCLEFIHNLSEERVIKWLKTRDRITTNCALKLSQTFSPDVIRNVWPNYTSIPFSDDAFLLDFLCLYLTTEDVPTFLKKYEDELPELLSKWTRDFRILDCKELSDNALKYLEEDPSLIKYFSKIFPSNESILDILSAVVANSIHSGNGVDSSVFDYFEPTEDFLKSFLLSSNISTITPGHALVNPLIKTIPTFIQKIDYSILEGPVINFVTKCELNPLDIKYEYASYPFFTAKYFGHFGFELLEPTVFCYFLESYLNAKIPWLSVFLYIRDINWQLMADTLWNFVCTKHEYAKICHKLNLQLALSCVCAASNIDTQLNNYLQAVNNSSTKQLSDSLSSYVEEIGLPLDSLTFTAIPSIEPPKMCIESELLNIIRMEWHQQKPKTPNFSSSENIELKLRQTVVYLRFFLPTLMVFDPVFDLLSRALENCENRLSFFFIVRIIGIIGQTEAIVPKYLLEKMILYVIKFAPFTSTIEDELINAFSVAKRLKSEEFNQIVIKCAPLFSSSLSIQLVRLILPLFQFFNAWDLLENNLDDQLDLNNILTWNFITNALFIMPSIIRTNYVKKYSKSVPPLLENKSLKLRHFEQLVTAFPITFAKWAENLDEKEYKHISKEMKQKVTKNIFKSVVKDILRLKLENTTIHSNVNTLILSIIYKEDDLAMPIKLTLKFPETFPIENLKIETDIGDHHLNKICDDNIKQTIQLTESIENGVKTWHTFVIQRVKDSDPCPICYSYFASDTKQAPSVKCGVCGQTFHRSCLRKWFEKCLFKTCPACATRWKEAK